MAIAELNKIDAKLNEIYADQVTTNASSNFVDKSNILFEQMNMIAFNNKMALHLK